MASHPHSSCRSANLYEQLLQLQTNQEFVTTLLDLHKDVSNNHELSELLRTYCANTVTATDFAAATEEHLTATNNHLIHEGARGGPLIVYDVFFHHLACVYRQQLLMREALQSFDNTVVEKLHRIRNWMKVSAALCTAASATSAAAAAANVNPKRAAVAAAAAAASILFGALGNRLHSLLKNKESAVKKHKEMIRVMIMGAKISIKDLTNIHVLARRLQFQTESMPEIVSGDVDAVAAWKKSFEELQGLANDYSRDTSWARAVVVQTIIKQLDN